MPNRVTQDSRLSRRDFSRTVVSAAAAGLVGPRLVAGQPPAAVVPEKDRPAIPYGVASGDVTADSAVIWSRCDRPGRMVVEWATAESFRGAARVAGPAALEDSDFTAKLLLRGLPGGQRVFYRVSFQDLGSPKVYGPPTVGSFRTAPSGAGDVLFAWGGDTCGQGWGINPDLGGLTIYETMRRLEPHFFVHSGDTIYADGPIRAEVKLDDGTVWRNLTTPAKSKVAETLAEYRGNYAYNLLDDNVRRFNAEVAQFVQWDDHEVINNWYPGEVLDEAFAAQNGYTERRVSLLAARGARAFREYQPVRFDPADPDRVFRAYRWGPSVELFLLDQRSYRGPNSANRQPEPGEETAFMGPRQIRWLKQRLLRSTATWKVICSDMPIGLVARDAGGTFENAANGNGPPLGRELEIADLLRFVRAERVRNVVWLTADVHYAAAHYYDPARARFADFDPFWEFVAGPLNAGNFGPGELDDTFGPQVKFQSYPRGTRGNQPPSAGLQFFGTVRVDGASGVMTVSLFNLKGDRLYSVDLPPAEG